MARGVLNNLKMLSSNNLCSKYSWRLRTWRKQNLTTKCFSSRPENLKKSYNPENQDVPWKMMAGRLFFLLKEFPFQVTYEFSGGISTPLCPLPLSMKYEETRDMYIRHPTILDIFLISTSKPRFHIENPMIYIGPAHAAQFLFSEKTMQNPFRKWNVHLPNDNFTPLAPSFGTTKNHWTLKTRTIIAVRTWAVGSRLSRLPFATSQNRGPCKFSTIWKTGSASQHVQRHLILLTKTPVSLKDTNKAC